MRRRCDMDSSAVRQVARPPGNLRITRIRSIDFVYIACETSSRIRNAKTNSALNRTATIHRSIVATDQESEVEASVNLLQSTHSLSSHRVAKLGEYTTQQQNDMASKSPVAVRSCRLPLGSIVGSKLLVLDK
jgi:hypothetical protein